MIGDEDLFDVEFNDLLNSLPQFFNDDLQDEDPIAYETQYYGYPPSLPYQAYSVPVAASSKIDMIPQPNMWFEPFDCSRFSRKIFIGKVPHHFTERSFLGQVLEHLFRRFGSVEIEWPRAATHISSNLNAPRLSGYLFLVYKSGEGVRQLLKNCNMDENGEFFLDAGLALEHARLHVRLWRLEDKDYCPDPSISLISTANAVFLGRVPRMSTASQLAQFMEQKFGRVIYAQIDIDMRTKYPQGCAVVFFYSPASYLHALNVKRIDLSGIANREWVTEIKPFVCYGGICDECGTAPSQHFCPHMRCLQYYCGNCWYKMHTNPLMDVHVPYKENKRRDLRGVNAYKAAAITCAKKKSFH